MNPKRAYTSPLLNSFEMLNLRLWQMVIAKQTRLTPIAVSRIVIVCVKVCSAFIALIDKTHVFICSI